MSNALQRHKARVAMTSRIGTTPQLPITSSEGELYRFNPESIRQLEKQLNAVHVNASTTDIQAGYMLGVQHVLSLLRNGFTVG